MARINLSEINSYVRNLYDRVGLRDLEIQHASRIREWFVANMSNIGRYGLRDFERFGSLNSRVEDDNVQKRQDGWQALTEEVPDIDHITYGTGILYVHGELEIPQYEDNSGNAIVGDEFGHVSLDDTAHFEVATVSAKNQFNQTQDGSDVTQGYKWNFSSETAQGEDNSGQWRWNSILGSVAQPETLSSWNAVDASGTATATATTPAVFNDAELYHLNNERNHYPYIIINSGQPASVDTLLQSLNGDNGMYDQELPAIAVTGGTYPPVLSNGLVITEETRRGILDFISPLNETPNGNS